LNSANSWPNSINNWSYSTTYCWTNSINHWGDSICWLGVSVSGILCNLAHLVRSINIPLLFFNFYDVISRILISYLFILLLLSV
jgi:hypothetical protein